MNKRLTVTASVLFASSLLAGCGLGSVATSTATEAATQAQAAKDAKALEDKMRHDIEDAQQASKRQVDDAEAAANR